MKKLNELDLLLLLGGDGEPGEPGEPEDPNARGKVKWFDEKKT